jgi:hypothetical protein
MKVSYKLGRSAGGFQSFGLSSGRVRHPTRRVRSNRQLFRGRGWGAFANDLESLIAIGFIGLFTSLSLLMSFILLLARTMTDHRHLSPVELVALWLEWAVIATVQCKGVEYLFTALTEAPRPRPVHAALRQRFRWLWLQMVVGIWWVINAIGMIAMGEGLIMLLKENTLARDRSTWEYQATVFLIFFGCSYAANTFILLAAATVRRRRGFVLAIWRSRILIDLGCALMAAGANFYVSVGDWYLR